MTAFLGEDGRSRIFVVECDERMLLPFACVPLTVVAALAGRRGCEVLGHPAFAPGVAHSEAIVVEAVAAQRPGLPVEGLVIAFDRAFDLSEAI